MSDQENPEAGSGVPPREQPANGSSWSSEHPTPTEHTRPLPPFDHPAPPAATAPARRSGAFTAAVLAGALLVGGSAGVGGAAWYNAWQGNSSQQTTTSSSTTASDAAAAPAAPTNGNTEQVAAAVLPSVVKINVSGQTESGSGSGIILSSDGDILTNNHVVAVAGRNGSITVNFNDGSTARASVVGTDPVTDIAVIKAEGVHNLRPARIGSSGNLRVGQSVIAVGSPFGLNATVTSGIVSALNRPVSVSTAEQQQPQDPFGLDPFGGQPQQQGGQDTTYPAIQTDAAINPGNSGGPLVDLAGRVVGINSSIRTSSSSVTGEGGSIGLGFAIPIDEVMPIVDQLLHHQAPTHARLGVTVSDTRGGSLQQGALVRDIDPSAAGKAAGLQRGDVITKVDNELVSDSEALVATIRGHRPGDQVKLTYVRDGQTHTTTATLGSDANTRSS
jgi:putative serine protease PepD